MKETLNEILAEPIIQVIGLMIAILAVAGFVAECFVTFEYYKDKKMMDDGYIWIQKTEAHWEKGSK